jgi:hypothetical protein
MVDENASGIHPAPTEFSQAQLAENPILQFFHYRHLPPKLQVTSYEFFALAQKIINTLPRNAERTVALRKLLEAKDAAVRATLPAPGFGDKPRVASQQLGEPREIQNATDDRDGPISFDG